MVAWTLFNIGQADRPCSQNPVNLRKKDVKHPLSYRYRITKKSQRSCWCLG
uniref:Photosystem II protein Y (PsbY) n=1 Tax=Siphoviridae sp. ctzjp2 TaxID=2826532 RepID=A0A8S5QMT5_9CAUD|nr:MAG TPA: Photosystem II protein Y (PsbY) [Siphoviridae sp. ctzjp2]